MAILQVQTFADIVNAVMEEVGYQAGDTTAMNRIKRDINFIYLNEVVPASQWNWLRGHISLSLPAKITAGTVSVVQNSAVVTLTIAPGFSTNNYWFSIEGQSERYLVSQHSQLSTTVLLGSPYTGPTASALSYAIWTDKMPLPVDCRETIEVTTDIDTEPLEGCGLQKFRKYSNPLPKAEGPSRIYSTNDYIDPTPFDSIADVPNSLTRASNGIIRTLTFSSAIDTFLVPGDRIRISSSNSEFYNGNFVVATSSGTTLTYVSTIVFTESTASDTAIVIEKASPDQSGARYRELWVYPARSTSKTTFHVDYIKEVVGLDDDDDEPLMPVSDRAVLVYGAASRAWTKERNPEESQANTQLYLAKLAKMQGKLDDSKDTPILRPSRIYVRTKRQASRWRGDSGFSPYGFNGSSSAPAVTGTASTVAVFDGTGALIGDANVSITELEELDGIGSKAVGVSDHQALTNKTISGATNTLTNVPNSATTATAINTPSTIVQRDGSGNFAAGTITAALSGNATTATTATTAGNVSGVVAIANGGTNSSISLNNNRILQSTGGKIQEAAGITAARALISDANGIPTQSAVTSATLAFLDATSSVQTQLNSALAGLNDPNLIANVGFTATVATNAMTITMVAKDGSALSSSNNAVINFRSATITNGTYVARTIAAAGPSIVIPSSATLGTSNSVESKILVWAIDNAGAIELAVSNCGIGLTDDILTSTTISGSATSASTFYSTTGRTSVAARLIGSIRNTQTTAGTWAAAPTALKLHTNNGQFQLAGTDEKSDLSFTINGFGTVTNSNIFYQRDRSNMLVRGSFTAGTLAASTASITLPLNIDTTKFNSQTNIQIVGTSNGRSTAVKLGDQTNNNIFTLFYDGSTAGTLFYSVDGGQAKINASGNFSNTDPLSFEFRIPIVGWFARDAV